MEGKTVVAGGRMMQERRRTPRYPFFASAELYEEKTDARVVSRLSELSLNGCYLDMMNPFPMGTVIRVKITSGEQEFESKAMVVYSTPNMGAGVAFVDVEPKYDYILRVWLGHAAKG
jgi:PilZ domain